MNDIEEYLQRAETICRTKDSRLTMKRKRILSILLTAEKALSAYELVDLCREQHGETIPAMSIYRILNFLEDNHLVHKLNLVNKYIACAYIDCNSSHDIAQFLICGKCSKVKEVPITLATMTELKNNVQESGYELHRPQFELNCYCATCT